MEAPPERRNSFKDEDGWSRLPKRVARDDTLSAETRLMYGHLDAHRNKRTGRCDPSTGRLAAVSGCSRRWVLEMLKGLETAGHIRVLRRDGHRNEYVLLADETGEPHFTAPNPHTCEAQFTGTGEPHFTGTCEPHFTAPSNPPYRDEQEQEEQDAREQQPIPPPNAGALQSQAGRQGSLFDTDFYEAVRRGAAFYLAEDPDAPEARLLPWFPPLVAEFFLAQSWHRPSDPRLAHFWARQLAAIGATSDEVARAFAWSLANPNDPSGRKVFARKDVLIRLLGFIESKRRQVKAQAAPRAPEPAAEPAGVSFGDFMRQHGRRVNGEAS